MNDQHLIMAVFGVCATGFFFLCGWLLKITTSFNSKVIKELEAIKNALLGDFKEKGIVTRVNQNEWHIGEIKKICEKNHAKIG